MKDSRQPELDYPSVASGALLPPGPVLLDTCVIQHLSYVTAVVEWDQWTDAAIADVFDRVGPNLAVEVLALMAVLSDFSDALVWAASSTAISELRKIRGPRRHAPIRQWHDLHEWWMSMVYQWPDELAHTIEPAEPEVSPHQLELMLDPQPPRRSPGTTPLGPFRDAGDRALIREATHRGFRTILTTDLRSLWRYRAWLYPTIEIWRPSDVMRTLGGSPEAFLERVGHSN